MASSSPEQPKSSLDAVKALNSDGDVLRNDHRFRRLTGFTTIGGSSIALASGMAVGLGYGAYPDIRNFSAMQQEITTTYPVYGLAATAAAVALYGARERRLLRKRQASEQLQDELRQRTEEDIDIITNSQNGTLLRWYGADEKWRTKSDDSTVLDIASRAIDIADTADEHNIKRIAVGSSLMGQYTLTRRASGKTFITDTKKASATLKDSFVDDKVLVLSPAHLRTIADDIRYELEIDTPDLIDHLIDGLKDITLRRSYDTYLRNPSEFTRKHFIDNVRQALTPLLENGSYYSVRQNEHGHVVQRKVTQSPKIHGTKIKTTQTWHGSDGHVGIESAPDALLLPALDANTRDQLLDELAGKEKITRKDRLKALGAVYLLGLDLESEEGREIPKLHSERVSERVRNLTTYQAYQQNRPRFLFTKKRMENDRLSYERKPHRVLRMLGVGALGAAWVFNGWQIGGAASGLSVNMENSAIESISFDAYSFDGDPEEMFNTALKEKLGDRSHLVDAVNHQISTNADISDFMTEQYIKLFGVDIANFITAGKASGKALDNIKAAPEGAFSKNGADMTGDVDPESLNKTVYSITSPTGKSTSGLWYGKLHEKLGMRPSQNAPGMAFTYSTSPSETYDSHAVPWEQDSLSKLAPDFIVKTPFLQPEWSGMLQMPVIQGGEIIGGAIIDKNDSSRRMRLPLIRDSQTGLYALLDSDLVKHINEHDISSPELQYYIKQTDTNTIRHNAPTKYNITDVTSETDAAQVAVEVKRALGLPDSASPEEIFSAIKQKKYSYTPIKDAGIANYREGSSDDFKDLTIELGTTLAELESLNCNLASVLQIIASQGSEEQFEQASGYRENGDGKLIKGEAHAWLLDKNTNVVDPTPPGTNIQDLLPDDSEMNSNHAAVDYTKWGGILVGSALTIMMYRRRKKIANDIQAARQSYILEHPDTPEAVTQIEAALYGHPDKTISIHSRQTVTRKDIASVASNLNADEIIERRKRQGEDISKNRKLKRAIRRLVRHQNSFR